MADNLIDVPDDNLANVPDTNLVDVPEPTKTAQQRYRQTLKAYHEQGTENPDVAPGYVSPETSEAFAEDKANIPKLGEEWGNVGTGAAKGLAGGIFGGFVGDIESLGRLPFQIPGVRENIADVSPNTAIPTSEEGGYLGPRGLGAFNAPENPEEKGGAFIGSLLAPFAATAPLKAMRGAIKLSSSAAEIANAAERQGINIPRAAITDNREIQTAAGYLKEIPFVGTPLVKASEKALSGIEDVAGRIVSALGSGNKLRAGDIASDAIEGWITGKSKTIATELYDAVDPLVNPEFTRPLFETKNVANEIAAKRANAKILGDSPAIREIEDALASPGMNYDGIKDLRTYIREMTPQEMVAKNINKNEAKRIYDALTTDLRATVLDAGGPDALKKFDKANDVYNIIADRRASIAKVIGVSADAAPEKVIDRITAMAGNAGSADYQTLQKVRKSIGPKSWDEISSAILAKMGRANPEAEFSADQFVTAWNKLSPNSKQLLFNSTNRPGIINDLNDLVTLSGAQKNLSKYANPSGPGKIATFAAMIPAMWTAPLPTIATIIGGRQMAKFFASPIAVKSTAQWAKANNAAFTTPNIMTTARLLSASDNIAKTLNREFGGNFSAKDFIPPGQANEPPRATGGSVFDKMHAAKHMQEGGGLESFIKSLGSQGAAFGTQTEQEQAGFQRDPIIELGKGAYNAVEHLAKENIDNANLLATGNRDQFSGKPGFEAGMLTMGTGAVAGVPMRAGEAVLGSGPIRAYHGSPYDFDKFDASKIGTGEGAQAYGHGLYFAEQEATAKAYRDTLQGKGFKIPQDVAALPDEQRFAILRAANAHGAQPDPLEAAKRAQWSSSELRSQPLEGIADKIARSRPPDGKMYEVNINAKPEQFLDWDKPLGQQPANVQNLVANGPTRWGGNDFVRGQLTSPSGEAIYKRIATDSVGKQGYGADHNAYAADLVNKAGIPGIKYLDQGSRPFSADALAGVQRAEAKIERLRASGETGYKLDDALQELQSAKRGVGDLSSNYVVFDPKIIEIMRKYGMTLPAATAAYEAMKTDQEKTGFKKGGSVFDKMKRASK